MGRSRWTRGWLAVGLGLRPTVGCTSPTPDDADVPAPEFGLGGKADGDLCDPAADLCWPTSQQAAIRTVLTGQDRLLLGVGDARANAQLMVSGIQDLTIKLTEDELDSLNDLSVQADAPAPDADEASRQAFLVAAQDGPAGALIAHDVSALSVPVGSAAEAESLGKADDFGAENDPDVRGDLTDGMRETWSDSGGHIP